MSNQTHVKFSSNVRKSAKCWPPRTKFSTHPCVRNKNIRQSTAPTGCSKSAQIGCSQFLRSTAVSAGPVSIQRNDPPCLPPVRRMNRSASRSAPSQLRIPPSIHRFVLQPQILRSTAASARQFTVQRDDPPCLHLCEE